MPETVKGCRENCRREGTGQKSRATLRARYSVFLASDTPFGLGNNPSQVRKCCRKTKCLCGAIPGLAFSSTAQHGCSVVLEMCPDPQRTKHAGDNEKQRW